MADQTLSDLKDMNGEEKLLYRDYSEDLDAHDSAIVDYDAYEAMDMGKTYDPVSKRTGNGLTDNMTSTIYLERAARVAGQLPDGDTRAFGKKDYGKGMFLDILRTNWIYPNANAQFDFLTKMYMWQYGSSEYNVMPMYYDINVNETTGYIGPDCWLWNPRNFIPQSGFTSITDMDYVHAIAYKSGTFFQDILDDEDDDTFDKDAIQSIITQLKNKTKESDTKRDTLSYRERMKQSTRQVAVVTRYEAGKKGRWITFLPDFGCKVIRNEPNPHKNSRIPFILKRCIPKLDSYYGNGDFQRSMPMQFANDGLDNFYFQGIKVNLFAPKAVNMQSAIRHTISNEPGSIWEFNGTPDVKNVEGSTAGLSTYQAAKGMAKGAIQSIAGTTDTRSSASDASDPAFGKTPEALKQIQDRESTRDNQDRSILERAMTELIDGFYSIIPTIEEKIPIDMFSDEIEEIIESGHTDLADMFTHMEAKGHASFRMAESGNQMRIKLNPQAFADITPRFQMKSGSTSKKTPEQQMQGMMDFWNFVGKMPNALQQYQEATGKVPDWEYTFKQVGDLLELPFLGKMFTKPGAQTATAPGQEGVPTDPNAPPADPNAAPVPGAPGAAPASRPPSESLPFKDVAAVAPLAAAAMLEQANLPGDELRQQQPPAAGPGVTLPGQQPQPAPQPAPQVPPEVLAASPEAPVSIAGHIFTNPSTAQQAFELAMKAGAFKQQQGAPTA